MEASPSSEAAPSSCASSENREHAQRKSTTFPQNIPYGFKGFSPLNSTYWNFCHCPQGPKVPTHTHTTLLGKGVKRNFLNPWMDVHSHLRRFVSWVVVTREWHLSTQEISIHPPFFDIISDFSLCKEPCKCGFKASLSNLLYLDCSPPRQPLCRP